MHIVKVWTVIDRWSFVRKADLSDQIKRKFFQAMTESVLLHGCTTWNLTKCERKSLMGTMREWHVLFWKKIRDTTIVQILDETGCISHSNNTLGKGMNLIILPPAMGKIVRLTRFFRLGEATSLGEGILWIRFEFRLKIDLVSYPARAEGLVNMYSNCTDTYLPSHKTIQTRPVCWASLMKLVTFSYRLSHMYTPMLIGQQNCLLQCVWFEKE